MVRNQAIGRESSLRGFTRSPINQPAFRSTCAITRVPEPPVAPMTTGGGAEESRGGTFQGSGSPREERSSHVLICCSRERGLLPIFNSRRKRSKELRHCELFTFIESLVRVVVASFDGSRSRELPDADNIALVRAYVQEQFVARGMIADLNVHKPTGPDGLPRPIAPWRASRPTSGCRPGRRPPRPRCARP